MTGVRETKKKQTRKAIMQAAMVLFGEKGFEKTSIEELARAAGIGKGTIYGYFQTKSDILHAFCEDELECLHEELTTNADKEIPILQQMVSIYMSEFRQITENREFARLFMQQTAFPRDVDLDRHLANEDNYFKLLFPLFEKAQERGELRNDMELLHITGHFYGLYLLLVSAWLSGRIGTEEAEPALEMLFRQALEGLQPRPDQTPSTGTSHE
ncbi:MAG: TetR/AcrR family transcriptional regulator [Proteobacteria bacterium]|nr:TetR/AcrR family transcriptional regulator [Pseudomonadota bacterium]